MAYSSNKFDKYDKKASKKVKEATVPKPEINGYIYSFKNDEDGNYILPITCYAGEYKTLEKVEEPMEKSKNIKKAPEAYKIEENRKEEVKSELVTKSEPVIENAIKKLDYSSVYYKNDLVEYDSDIEEEMPVAQNKIDEDLKLGSMSSTFPQDYSTGYANGYSNGYANGYTNGYNNGYSSGIEVEAASLKTQFEPSEQGYNLAKTKKASQNTKQQSLQTKTNNDNNDTRVKIGYTTPKEISEPQENIKGLEYKTGLADGIAAAQAALKTGDLSKLGVNEMGSYGRNISSEYTRGYIEGIKTML